MHPGEEAFRQVQRLEQDADFRGDESLRG
jgi:hypothetical protein